MKRMFLLLSLATFVAALLPQISAQAPMKDPGVLHAPDGNSFTRIVSIFISPIPDAPFSAIVSTEWTRQASDGASVVVKNRRMVARDSQGHVFEERRRFVPADSSTPSLLFQVDYVDPAHQTRTICIPAARTCDVRTFFVPVSEAALPVGPLADGRHYLSRENLGQGEIEGLETIGSRETVTATPGTVGNDREVARTKEFWYSPQLGINLVVKRFDPLEGTQVFTVSNISLAEPDPRLFVVPAGYKLIDLRAAETSSAK